MNFKKSQNGDHNHESTPNQCWKFQLNLQFIEHSNIKSNTWFSNQKSNNANGMD